jgi:hypothetical protein
MMPRPRAILPAWSCQLSAVMLEVSGSISRCKEFELDLSQCDLDAGGQVCPEHRALMRRSYSRRKSVARSRLWEKSRP